MVKNDEEWHSFLRLSLGYVWKMLSFVGKHITFFSKDVYSFSVFKWKGVKPTSTSNKIIKYVDMFKKHRQDCEHPKNAQFDIYANFKFL